MRSEISLNLLLEDPSVKAVIPRVEIAGHMTMRSYDAGHLVRHRLGFDEPNDAASVVDPADLDIVLVPGLAFDGTGGRLGRGKGYMTIVYF